MFVTILELYICLFEPSLSIRHVIEYYSFGPRHVQDRSVHVSGTKRTFLQTIQEEVLTLNQTKMLLSEISGTVLIIRDTITQISSCLCLCWGVMRTKRKLRDTFSIDGSGCAKRSSGAECGSVQRHETTYVAAMLH